MNRQQRPQPRHRRLRRGRARLHARDEQSTRSACSTWGRSDAASSCAPGCRSTGPIPSRGRPSKRRPFASTTRSPAAALRWPAEQHIARHQLGADLDYVRGIHTFRTGIAPRREQPRGRTTHRTISAPTRSRASTRFSQGGRAATRGASAIPTSATEICRAPVYFQDDIRVRRNLTLSPGVRYEAQTHVRDYNNVVPRFGVTWSPFSERPHDAAGERGHLLRLAADEHLRADAARRRASASGS